MHGPDVPYVPRTVLPLSTFNLLVRKLILVKSIFQEASVSFICQCRANSVNQIATQGCLGMLGNKLCEAASCNSNRPPSKVGSISNNPPFCCLGDHNILVCGYFFNGFLFLHFGSSNLSSNQLWVHCKRI